MISVDLQGVSKVYRQVEGRPMLIKRLATPWKAMHRELWALRDVSLSFEAGETVGVIGRNGSGKTTLLRLLSGVSAPSSGSLTVRGRTAPLIGVGVGFNAELSGRENIDVNGRLLGMGDAEVRRKFDAIVDFSEIEEFIDTPVKYYSSGMFLRLAFAVAIHTEPEVLLVDEVLAVGDLAFQLKCLERMREIQAGGATIVIVTHNLATLSRLAPRTVLLSSGRVVFDGPTDEALGAYHELMHLTPEGELLGEPGSRDATIRASLHGSRGAEARHFAPGEQIVVRARAEFERPVAGPRVGVMVAPAGLGAPCYTTFTFPGRYRGTHGPGRPLEVDVALANPLLAGSYTVRVGIYEGREPEPMAITPAESFFVTTTPQAEGFVDMNAVIRLNGKEIRRPVQERLGGRQRARPPREDAQN